MQTSTPRTTTTIVVLAAVLLLGACATGSPPADEPAFTSPTVTEPVITSSPSTEPDPTPTPTPTPTPSPVVNGPNSIEAPSPGESVAGPSVVVSGEGTAFEATLNYRVLVAGTDEVVDEGWTMAGANGEIGPYSVELILDPGEYTVQVWEPDMSDGESPDGPYRNLVEVTFTVT